MEATQKTKAIILKRETFYENNSRVFVYSQNFGKLILIARGTQKMSSKLAPHLEPLNLCELMIIEGKQYNYIGSCISENVFSGVKNNYQKLIVAGSVARLLDDILKGEERDERIFLMLHEFLKSLSCHTGEISSVSLQAIKSSFLLKAVFLLGYVPKFSDLRMGDAKISLKLANFMQMILNMPFKDILEMDFENKLILEFGEKVNKYKIYIFD